MLRFLDHIWFRIADMRRGYTMGFNEGLDAGTEITKAVVLRELSDKNPNLKDKSFQLGYAHAVEVVKGNIK